MPRCTILQSIVPQNAVPAPGDQDQIVADLSKSASAWEQEIRGLRASDRMRKWLERSQVAEQHWLFLPLVIQARYAAAYPIFEANFLRRAAEPDASLALVLSYIRHRRKAAANFESQLNAIVRQHRLTEDAQFFLRVCHLLVRNESLDGDIQDWLAGRIDLETLYELSARSVDLPLIIPDADRSIAEANLQSAVAAADREHAIEKRLALVLLAEGAANILVNELIPRCSTLANQPIGGSHAPEWKEMVAQLRSLLADRRITTEEISVATQAGGVARWSLTTPAEGAAKVVSKLWGPDSAYNAQLSRGGPRDWRTFAIDERGSTRSLVVDSAKDFLNHPEEPRAAEYPIGDAVRLARQFTTGAAVDWRKQLAALRWDERLLVQAQLQHDGQLAVRFWPRLVELVDYQFAEPAKSATFETLWRDKLAGHNLDGPTWAGLRDWVAAEAAAGRWWLVIGESFPCRPGVSLFVFPSPHQGPTPSGAPELVAELDGGYSMSARLERDKITSAGLKYLPPDGPDLGYPTPPEALARQAKLTAKGNRVNTRGFHFQMVAMPGKVGERESAREHFCRAGLWLPIDFSLCRLGVSLGVLDGCVLRARYAWRRGRIEYDTAALATRSRSVDDAE